MNLWWQYISNKYVRKKVTGCNLLERHRACVSQTCTLGGEGGGLGLIVHLMTHKCIPFATYLYRFMLCCPVPSLAMLYFAVLCLAVLLYEMWHHK